MHSPLEIPCSYAKLVKGQNRWYLDYKILKSDGSKKRVRRTFALNKEQDLEKRETEFLKIKDSLNSSFIQNNFPPYTNTSLIQNQSNLSFHYSSSQKEEKIKPSQTVLEFLNYYVNLLTEREKLGTADKYRQIQNLFKDFEIEQDLMFEEIGRTFLEDFETYLIQRRWRGKPLSPNTIKSTFKTFRTLYNKAIQHGVANQKDYPFKNMMNVNGYSFSKFKSTVPVRCLDIDELDLIKNYKGEFQLSKNIFLFLYYACGMYISDAALLNNENIIGDSIQYKRIKTGGRIPPIKIHSKLKKIMNTFRGDGHFILNILKKDRHITPQQQRNRIHKITPKINNGLRQIAKEVGIEKPLTTRVARHTFANKLRRKGYTVFQIMNLLGHAEVSTTQIYLGTIDDGEYLNIGDDL